MHFGGTSPPNINALLKINHLPNICHGWNYIIDFPPWALWHLTVADTLSSNPPIWWKRRTRMNVNESLIPRVTFISRKSPLSFRNFLFNKAYSFRCFCYDVIVGLPYWVLNHERCEEKRRKNITEKFPEWEIFCVFYSRTDFKIVKFLFSASLVCVYCGNLKQTCKFRTFRWIFINFLLFIYVHKRIEQLWWNSPITSKAD